MLKKIRVIQSAQFLNLPAEKQGKNYFLPKAVLWIVGSFFCLPVSATDFMTGIFDGFHPYVDYAVTYDSNVLRLPDASAVQNGQIAKLSDVFQHLEAGINAQKKIGKQEFIADLDVNRTWFNYFSALDNNGSDVLLKWNWQLGNHLQGDVGTSYSRALAPFVDSRSLDRNVRSQKRAFANGIWHFHPSWQVRTGFTHYDLNYEADSQDYLDRTEDTTELGLDYLPSTHSSIGLQARHIRGILPNRDPAFINPATGKPVDNSYIQNELMGKINWQLSGKTGVQFLGGYVTRDHDEAPVRDFKGFNARAVGTWMPTSKVGLTLNAWREAGAYENLTASYTLNRGLSLTPTWELTSKLRLDGLLRYEKREYAGDSFYVYPGGVTRLDKARYASISLQYKPVQKMQIELSAYRDERDSNYSTYFYRANGLAIHSRYQF